MGSGISVVSWDMAKKRWIKVPLDKDASAIEGLPYAPVNSKKNEYGCWVPSIAFGSIVQVDLSKTGRLVDIPDAAFAYCVKLQVVILNPETRSIGEAAFGACSNLESIGIPTSVRRIGGGAFVECSWLWSIKIPGAVTSIEAFTFAWCSGLMSVNLPSGVTTIGESAFERCSFLFSINIPIRVTLFGSAALSRCHCLRSIKIPGGVTSIAESTFSGCFSLEAVSIPGGVTQIDRGAFDGCISDLVLLGGPQLLWLERFPTAKRVAAGWLEPQFLLSGLGFAADRHGMFLASQMVYTATESDWRLLGSLENSPLEE